MLLWFSDIFKPCHFSDEFTGLLAQFSFVCSTDSVWSYIADNFYFCSYSMRDPRRLRTPSWKLIESNFVYTKPCFPLIIIKMRTWLKYLTYTCMHKSSLGYYNTPLQLACHYLFICAAFAVFVSLAPYLFSPPNFSHPLPTCVQY